MGALASTPAGAHAQRHERHRRHDDGADQDPGDHRVGFDEAFENLSHTRANPVAKDGAAGGGLSNRVLRWTRLPGIGVITNPRSKANKRDPAGMHRLAYLLGREGSAEATRSLDDLQRAAEEFKAAGIDILGINGGDGTIHVTLTTFLKVYGDAPFPKVAILRGGTLNTIATGVGITGKPNDILLQVIERYSQGLPIKTIDRPVMQIGDKYGFLFGNGLIGNFMEAYYASKRPSPAMGGWLVLRACMSAAFRTPFVKRIFKRMNAHVQVDGQEWARRDFATIAAGTVPELGLGFTPFYRCWEKPGHFALIGFHCTPFQLAAQLPRIFRGKPLRRDRAISDVARECRIVTDEEVAYVIDGDVHRHKGEMIIRTGPTLQLIVPEWGKEG
jgi:diacylglycerol kinase (ATP)